MTRRPLCATDLPIDMRARPPSMGPSENLKVNASPGRAPGCIAAAGVAAAVAIVAARPIANGSARMSLRLRESPAYSRGARVSSRGRVADRFESRAADRRRPPAARARPRRHAALRRRRRRSRRRRRARSPRRHDPRLHHRARRRHHARSAARPDAAPLPTPASGRAAASVPGAFAFNSDIWTAVARRAAASSARISGRFKYAGAVLSDEATRPRNRHHARRSVGHRPRARARGR